MSMIIKLASLWLSLTIDNGGNRVEVAHNGHEAIADVKSNDYALDIMDIRMPILDGIEVTKQIRQLPETKRFVPIIATTADTTGEHVRQFGNFGFNVAPKAHLLTDGFMGYQGRHAALGDHLRLAPIIQGAGANAASFFPIIHILFSNIKSWLVGTHHGVAAKHLPRYLWEWAYRFNRRNLPEGIDGYLIRRAIECATITYDELVTGHVDSGKSRKRRFALASAQLVLAGLGFDAL